jgi:hypothetical protein
MMPTGILRRLVVIGALAASIATLGAAPALAGNVSLQPKNGPAVVEHTPTLYLIFWGNWGATASLSDTTCGSVPCTAATLQPQLSTLYQGLSLSNFQHILTQYYDGTGYVSNAVAVYSYSDSSTPTDLSYAGVETEAKHIAQANGLSLNNPNDQYIVLPAPGTNYTARFTATASTTSTTLTNVSNFNNVREDEYLNGPGIANLQVTSVNPSQGTITLNKAPTAGGSGVAITGYNSTCGWHDNDGNLVYTLIPFPHDSLCGQYPPVDNNYMSVIASHEYAEAVTDPLTETEQGWFDPNANPDANEIADICEGNFPSSWVDLPFGWVQPIRDNALNACETSDPTVYGPQLPVVSAVSPSSGPNGGGTTVTVTGQNFLAGATNVSFGPTAATSVTVTSPTSLTAVSPPGTGAVDVTVTTAGGTSATSSADQFTYPLVTPTITGLSPNQGPKTGGTPVTITGTGFYDVTTVRFNKIVVPFTVKSPTSISVVTPPVPSDVTVNVQVLTNGGWSTNSAATQFTFTG